MKCFSMLLFLVLYSFVSLGQNNIIIGQVIDADSGEPLSFSSVGWVNQNKGTVSDQVGKFRLETLTEHQDQILRISKMGYKTLNFSLEEILKNCSLRECPMVFELSQTATELPEFTLEAEGDFKNIVWGKANRKSIFGLAYNPKDRKPEENLGREIGLQIDTKGKKIKLEQVKITLSSLQFEKSTFRVNIYTETGENEFVAMPQNREIFWQLERKNTGDFILDLSEFNILLKGKHLIGIEWVRYEKMYGSGIISMTTGYPFGKSFLKNSSQNQWEIIKGAPSIEVDGAVVQLESN